MQLSSFVSSEMGDTALQSFTIDVHLGLHVDCQNNITFLKKRSIRMVTLLFTFPSRLIKVQTSYLHRCHFWRGAVRH